MTASLPPDVDELNHKRAQWAKTAVQAFIAQTGVDYEDALGDLLCDLMHLSDREPFDFEAALDRARGHYAAETATIDSSKTWNVHETSDPDNPVGDVTADSYDAAIRAALIALGYFVTKRGTET
jgi:hypothetical protein